MPDAVLYGFRVFVFASAARLEYREATYRVVRRPLDEVDVLRSKVSAALAKDMRTKARPSS